MDQRLKAILQKAKAIDERAKKYDNVDTATLESNVSSRKSGLNESTPQSKPTQKLDVGSETYKQRVKESKLPPEIQRAMLENPIPQPDTPGTFSMEEDDIREINPKYNSVDENYYSEDDEIDFMNEQRHVKQNRIVTNKTSEVSDNNIRKMIAEEIAKVLPNIVEKYFDKKMIQENVKMLRVLTNKTKRQ